MKPIEPVTVKQAVALLTKYGRECAESERFSLAEWSYELADAVEAMLPVPTTNGQSEHCMMHTLETLRHRLQSLHARHQAATDPQRLYLLAKEWGRVATAVAVVSQCVEALSIDPSEVTS